VASPRVHQLDPANIAAANAFAIRLNELEVD
jgi:hypothetical protein